MRVRCVSVIEHVWVGGSRPVVGGEGYQPGVYVPFKARFLVFLLFSSDPHKLFFFFLQLYFKNLKCVFQLKYGITAFCDVH